MSTGTLTNAPAPASDAAPAPGNCVTGTPGRKLPLTVIAAVARMRPRRKAGASR